MQERITNCSVFFIAHLKMKTGVLLAFYIRLLSSVSAFSLRRKNKDASKNMQWTNSFFLKVKNLFCNSFCKIWDIEKGSYHPFLLCYKPVNSSPQKVQDASTIYSWWKSMKVNIFYLRVKSNTIYDHMHKVYNIGKKCKSTPCWTTSTTGKC